MPSEIGYGASLELGVTLENAFPCNICSSSRDFEVENAFINSTNLSNCSSVSLKNESLTKIASFQKSPASKFSLNQSDNVSSLH